MTSEQLTAEFSQGITARHDGTADAPGFAALWTAFTTMARIPVEDMVPTGDDELGFSARWEDATMRLRLSRTVSLEEKMVDFYVICEFPGVRSEGASVIGTGGTEESVNDFATKVEALPVFRTLGSAPKPTRCDYGQDEID